jgi:ribulose kinase
MPLPVDFALRDIAQTVRRATNHAPPAQEHADALQRPLVLPDEPEAVLLGAAILAAVSAGCFKDLPQAMGAMCRSFFFA